MSTRAILQDTTTLETVYPFSGSNLTNQSVPNSALDTTVTLQGNDFNAANQLVQLESDGNLPVLDGSNLINLPPRPDGPVGGDLSGMLPNPEVVNGSHLEAATVPNSALQSSVTTQGNTFNTAGNLIQADDLGNYPALNAANATVVEPTIGQAFYYMIGGIAMADGTAALSAASLVSSEGGSFRLMNNNWGTAYRPGDGNAIRDEVIEFYAPGGYWLMAYTHCNPVGFTGTAFGLAKSFDLVNWIHVADVTPAGYSGTVTYVWMGDIVLDDSGNWSVVFTINQDEPYYITCSNPGTWTSWSNVTVVGGLPTSAVNGIQIQKINGTWYCFYDNKTTHSIGYATSSSALSGYGSYTNIATPSGSFSSDTYEGQSMVWMGGSHWRDYFQIVGTGFNDVMYYVDSFDDMATWGTTPALLQHNLAGAATCAHVYRVDSLYSLAHLATGANGNGFASFNDELTVIYGAKGVGGVAFFAGVDPSQPDPFAGATRVLDYTTNQMRVWLSPEFLHNITVDGGCTVKGDSTVGGQMYIAADSGAGGSSMVNIQNTSDAFPQIIWWNSNAKRWAAVNYATSNDWILYNFNLNANILHVFNATGNVAITTDTDDGSRFQVAGDVSITQAGSTVRIKRGTNAKSGTFTLASGLATVANTSVTANSVIMWTLKTLGGTRGLPCDIVPTPGTGFTVSATATDNSTYNYVILEVN